MVVSTIIALFLDLVRDLFIYLNSRFSQVSADRDVAKVLTACLIFFIMDIALTSIALLNYFGSIIFFLDLVRTLFSAALIF